MKDILAEFTCSNIPGLNMKYKISQLLKESLLYYST